MLQQVMTNPKEITFREVPVPEITAEQVLVKIKRIASVVLTSMFITESTHLPATP